MHKLKFFVCIFLASLLMVSPAFALDTDKAETESVSLVAYNNLTISFDTQKRNNEFAGEYPDYYGGAYIDDNGKLVVLVTNRTSDTKSLVKSLTQSSDIVIRYSPISLNELLTQQSIIMDKMMDIIHYVNNTSNKVDADLYALVDAFVGIGVSSKNHNLFVEFNNDTESIRDAFTKYISNYEGIDFKCFNSGIEATNKTVPTPSGNQTRGTHYQGGYCNFGGNAGSIGYRARYNGVNGFVTAGHCVSEYETNIGIGDVGFRQIQGALDVAFIELHSGETVSNMTACGDVMSGYICDVPENATVYFCGYSSGRLTGTVASTNYVGATDQFLTTFSDMLRIVYSNGTTYAGDSGGLVYTYYNSSAYRAVGVHHGTPRVLSGSVATKATRISSIAGITAY